MERGAHVARRPLNAPTEGEGKERPRVCTRTQGLVQVDCAMRRSAEQWAWEREGEHRQCNTRSLGMMWRGTQAKRPKISMPAGAPGVVAEELGLDKRKKRKALSVVDPAIGRT